MRKRILITGFSGFVARHFVNYLVKNEIDIEIWGIDVVRPKYSIEECAGTLDIHFHEVDLLDKIKLNEVVKIVQPDYILHLAAFSSVAFSWERPELSFSNNANIFLNLIMAVKELGLKTRILSVGSSETYGKYGAEAMPLSEEYELIPCNPYAVAKVSQEMLAKLFTEHYGMDIIITRSFNHIGAWQDSRFVIPGFVKKVLALKDEGCTEGSIETGDLSIVRDFLDVRDVVRAYWMLLCNGKSGEVYNICSGKGIKLSEILDMIGMIAGVKVTGIPSPKLIRPDENKMIIGSNRKMYQELGWKPEIDLRQTLEEMILQ